MWSPEHGATQITAPLGKKNTCRTAVDLFWLFCMNTSVTLWGQKRGEVVGSPPNSLCAFPDGCQNLKGAMKHFSWDKQVFFPQKGCCFLCSHLAVLLIASVHARSCGSGCAHQLRPNGLPNRRALQQHPQTDMRWHIQGSDSIQSLALSLTPRCLRYGNHSNWCRAWGRKWGGLTSSQPTALLGCASSRGTGAGFAGGGVPANLELTPTATL